jgi:hypothetical protein
MSRRYSAAAAPDGNIWVVTHSPHNDGKYMVSLFRPDEAEEASTEGLLPGDVASRTRGLFTWGWQFGGVTRRLLRQRARRLATGDWERLEVLKIRHYGNTDEMEEIFA